MLKFVEFLWSNKVRAFLVPGGRDTPPLVFCKADLELLHRF